MKVWSRHVFHGDSLDFAKDRGVSIADLQMQLDFMWKELNDSHPAVLIVLKEAKSVREASDAVLMWYEKPADLIILVVKGLLIHRHAAGCPPYISRS